MVLPILDGGIAASIPHAQASQVFPPATLTLFVHLTYHLFWIGTACSLYRTDLRPGTLTGIQANAGSVIQP
jgi:hypothetical protein